MTIVATKSIVTDSMMHEFAQNPALPWQAMQ
jgi:hypothetical protein